MPGGRRQRRPEEEEKRKSPRGTPGTGGKPPPKVYSLEPDEFDIAIRNAALSDLLLARKTTGRLSTFVTGQRGIYSFDEPVVGRRSGGIPGRRPTTGKRDLFGLAPSTRSANATAVTEAARTGLDYEISPQFTFVTPSELGVYNPDKTVLG